MRFSSFAAATATLCFCTLARAISIVEPSAVTQWNQNGNNIIQWSLVPATYPPPASPFFDIYLRNGIGWLYNPFLNLSVATNVDASASTEIAFSLAGQLRPGDGYQLFFTAPGDANTAFCQSDVFIISSGSDPAVTDTTDSGSSSTSASASPVDSSTSEGASPTAESSSSMTPAQETTTTQQQPAGTTPAQGAATTTSSKSRIETPAAPEAPGGSAEQSVSAGATKLAASLVLLVAGGVAMLL